MDLKDFHRKQIGIFSRLDAEKQAQLSVSLNQYYQDRVEKLRTRLWGTLTWLAAAQGAALLLIVKEGGLRTVTVRAVKMEEPILVLLLACFGFILAVYMLAIIGNGKKHLTSNFHNSDFALDLPYIAPPAPASTVSADECERRKDVWEAGKAAMRRHLCKAPPHCVWRLLRGLSAILALPIGGLGMELPFRIMWVLSLAAVVLDLLIMTIGGMGVWQWASGKDIPYILIPPLNRV